MSHWVSLTQEKRLLRYTDETTGVPMGSDAGNNANRNYNQFRGKKDHV